MAVMLLREKLGRGAARCCSFSTFGSLSGRGNSHFIRGLGLTDEELEDTSPEDLDDLLHPDVDTVRRHTQQLEVDAKIYNKFLRKKTIEHKYFKSKGPHEENLLTWAMKEQLRYLHSSDPDYWTPEALSQAFPISAEGAMKMIRVRWSPWDEAAIKKHDKVVAARWKKLMKGKLGSGRLIEKLNERFTNEKTPVTVPGIDKLMENLESLKFEADEQPYVAKELKPKQKLPKAHRMKYGSFASIIEDYENKKSDLQKNSPSSASKGQETCITRAAADTHVPELYCDPPTYEGVYFQVADTRDTRFASDNIKNLRLRSKLQTTMTHREFMKRRHELSGIAEDRENESK